MRSTARRRGGILGRGLPRGRRPPRDPGLASPNSALLTDAEIAEIQRLIDLES